MMLLGFLLLPMVMAAGKQLNINNYVIKIEENTLTSIEATIQSPEELNLSNLNLRNVNKNVFDHLSNIKILNLANNSLSSIPELAFVNLTNLEHLNLSNNEISRLDNAFVGLNKLKSLNVSNNPLEHLERGWLFGLTNSCDVFIRSNSLGSISTGIFENPFPESVTPPQPSVKDLHKGIFKYNPAIHGPSATSAGKPANDINEVPQPLNSSLRVKVCIQEGKVKLLEALKEDEALASDCFKVVIDYGLRKLTLRGLGISGFENGWYRLQGFPINAIDLDGNGIVRVTRELLNDLPEGLKEVTLRGNKIERLEKGIIENKYLSTLDLSDNFILEIEGGALEKTNLTDGLILNGNRLKDTKFAATLPTNLTKLYLRDNEIAEISSGSFSKLGKLSNLELDGNNITAVQRQSLQGLPSLRFLTLSNNGLRTIESGAFEDLSFLRILDLENNNMSSLDADLFNGLDILLTLKISRNNFSKITKKTMAGLPYTVHTLALDHNGIESLSSDSFDHVPILDLSLDGNKISKIEKGSFNLPTLRYLSLKNNSLGEFNGDSFEGLRSLKHLSLAGNGITKIQKGAVKNLGSLNILDISNNPIKELENGALYGLQKSGRRVVHVVDTPIELIQGGLFDDV